MDVHALGWIALAAIILTMITIDVVGHVRTPHEPSMREAAAWSAAYIAMACAFGAVVWAVWGGRYGQEYFAGYITEKALSIDNLFVFVIMLAAFRVPRAYQQEVLLAGIVIALVLRLVFILAGAALIENFSAIFYVFGAWLIYTAVAQAREGVQRPAVRSTSSPREAAGAVPAESAASPETATDSPAEATGTAAVRPSRTIDSEEERLAAISDLGPEPEITRFKGLGEISPDEFAHFIGPDMRLEQVTLHKNDQVAKLLEYYMGKNTMERQNFIIDNLVIEEDLPEENGE